MKEFVLLDSTGLEGWIKGDARLIDQSTTLSISATAGLAEISARSLECDCICFSDDGKHVQPIFIGRYVSDGFVVTKL